mmetsp:Transcript_15398/g.26435  ORF Transcript_15398/g.26435 Transcript_15398/m.26435 type:complete len:455 (-) Transcript_15398:66-1430(-)
MMPLSLDAHGKAAAMDVGTDVRERSLASKTAAVDVILETKERNSQRSTRVVGTSTAEARLAANRLRAIMSLLVVLHHITEYFIETNVISEGFENENWFIADTLLGTAAIANAGYMLLGGFGSYYSLRSRTTKAYIRERSARLLTPFVFGVLVLNPLWFLINLAGLGVLSDYSFSDFWVAYIENYVNIFSSSTTSAIPGSSGLPQWGRFLQLWFLPALYLCCLIGLPLMRYLHRVRPRKMEPTTTLWVSYAVLIFFGCFLFCIDIINIKMLEALGSPAIPINVLNVIWYFFLGAFMAWDKQLFQGIVECRWPLLFLLFPSLYMSIRVGFTTSALFNMDPIWNLVLWNVFRLSYVFCFFGFILAFIGQVKGWPAKTLDYIADKSFPLYVLHLVVTIGIMYGFAYGVKAWFEPRDSFLYVLVIFVVSLFSTFGLYEICFRWPYVRGLAGNWKITSKE